MAVANYCCENCKKQEVCKICDTINKFSDMAKKPLGVDITIDECQNFDAVDSEYEDYATI